MALDRAFRFLAAFVTSCCALLAFGIPRIGPISALWGRRGGWQPLQPLHPQSRYRSSRPDRRSDRARRHRPCHRSGHRHALRGYRSQHGWGETNTVSLITIDRTTGAGTFVGKERPDNEGAADITFTPDGTLYGWLEPGTDSLVTIDKATGAATIVGDSGLNTYGSGIASNSSGVLYFAGEGSQGPLRTVDRSTGLTTQVATLNGPDPDPGISALAFDAAGMLFGSRLPRPLPPSTAICSRSTRAPERSPPRVRPSIASMRSSSRRLAVLSSRRS